MLQQSTEYWKICWYHDYKETDPSAVRGGNLLTRYLIINYRIYSINRPGRLFHIGPTRVGAYYFPNILRKQGHF